MEKNVRAFFYNYKYYIFPEGVETLDELKSMGGVVANRLQEEMCMAPNFIYESIVEETVEFDAPDRVFEISVNLYSAKEYDDILLKKIEETCQGCIKKEIDKEYNLSGYHRRMPLSGICYEKRVADGENFTFSECIDWFWFRLSEKLDELANYIDANDQKKLNSTINKILGNIFFKTEFYGTVYNGKYTLCFVKPLYGPHSLACAHALLTEFVMCGEYQLTKENWVVLPYVPKGVYIGHKTVDPKKVRYKLIISDSGNNFILLVHNPRAETISDKTKLKYMHETYNYLLYEIGSPAILKHIEEIVVENDREDLHTLEEICGIINKVASEEAPMYEEKDGSIEYPHSTDYSTDIEYHEDSLPYRERVDSCTTVCPEMTFASKEMLKRPDVCWWFNFFDFVYIYIPYSPDDERYPIGSLLWYLGNMDKVPAPLKPIYKTGISGRTIGIAMAGEYGYFIDNMVFSKDDYFIRLRLLAPILRAFNAKVVAVTKNGIEKYECDFDMIPIP